MPSRRHWLKVAGALPIAWAGAATLKGAESLPAPEPPPGTAAEALERLKAGNTRFVIGKMRHAHQAADWRAHLVAGQQPFATVLACSDSRVSPELVFDQGFGDLFVIRVAGNVIASDVIGSIEYAVEHLRTPLLLVVGHESCGAVTAAVQALAGKAPESKYINSLVKLIEPGLQGLDKKLTGEARIQAAVTANVKWSLRQLAALPETQQEIAQQRIQLAGAVYDLQTGVVKFL